MLSFGNALLLADIGRQCNENNGGIGFGCDHNTVLMIKHGWQCDDSSPLLLAISHRHHFQARGKEKLRLQYDDNDLCSALSALILATLRKTFELTLPVVLAPEKHH